MRKTSPLRRNGNVVGYSVYLGLDGVNWALTDVVSFYLKHGTRNQTKKLTDVVTEF